MRPGPVQTYRAPLPPRRSETSSKGGPLPSAQANMPEQRKRRCAPYYVLLRIFLYLQYRLHSVETERTSGNCMCHHSPQPFVTTVRCWPQRPCMTVLFTLQSASVLIYARGEPHSRFSTAVCRLGKRLPRSRGVCRHNKPISRLASSLVHAVAHMQQICSSALGSVVLLWDP